MTDTNNCKLETIWDKLIEDKRHMTSMYIHARKNKRYYDATQLKNTLDYIDILLRYRSEEM